MKEVLIFGASAYGKRVQYSLDDRDYKVTALIDNNKEIQGKLVYDIPVIEPNDIEKYEYDNIIISISQFETEIKTQLLSLGVPKDKIITY